MAERKRILFIALALIFLCNAAAFSKNIFITRENLNISAAKDMKIKSMLPENITSGYELWNNRGIAYVYRDQDSRVINFADFSESTDTSDQTLVNVTAPDKSLYFTEKKGTVSVKGPFIPFMTSRGVFISFLSYKDAEQKMDEMAEKELFVNTPFVFENTKMGDPILPGQEQYNSQAETEFHVKGFEVLGNVRPWSHNLVKGNNILISRSQKIKVDFKGPFTQNFYIFRASKNDSTGILFWFSGNFGYSGKTITIPVEGGWYYGFCSDTPKKQTITIHWDNRP